jgi:hypothetical protein
MDSAVIPNNVRGNTMANLAGVLKELQDERARWAKTRAQQKKAA